MSIFIFVIMKSDMLVLIYYSDWSVFTLIVYSIMNIEGVCRTVVVGQHGAQLILHQGHDL